MIHICRAKDNRSPCFLAVKQLAAFDYVAIVYKLCPENQGNKFYLRPHHSKYNAQLSRNFQIPKYTIEYAKKGVSYSALKTWDEIPSSIRGTSDPRPLAIKTTFDQLKINQLYFGSFIP